MSDVECPKCDRTFDSTRSMKYHHNYEHGESIAGVEIECDYCGKTETRNPAKIKGQENVYCSPDCQHSDRIEIPKSEIYDLYWGEGLPTSEVAQRKGISQQVVARRANEHGVPIRDNDSPGSFVVKMLTTQSLKRLYADKKMSTYDLTDYFGVSLEFIRQELHRRGVPVRSRYLSDRLEHYEVKTETYDYGDNWEEQRQKALERDSHTCQGCGDTSATMHVHHIKPLRTFETPEDANVLSNLVTYCPPCHRKWELIPVRPTAES